MKVTQHFYQKIKCFISARHGRFLIAASGMVLTLVILICPYSQFGIKCSAKSLNLQTVFNSKVSDNLRVKDTLAVTALSSTSSEVTVTDEEKLTIYQLTSIFENSTTELQYNYIQNIQDGRGYTFGYVGFCSGTYDGNLFLKEYQKLNPNNPLVSYIPKFDYIDSLPHSDDGLCGYLGNIPYFAVDFEKCSQKNDPAFIQAQLNVANRLYWQPSQKAANEIGAKYPITFGEIYDTFMNMGEDGARSIMTKTTQNMGGTPATGVDEKAWLSKFLSIRLGILNSDPVWKQSTDRVTVYQTLLAKNNVSLKLPITLSCYGSSFTLNHSSVNK